jgi:hypothetical protein
VSLFFNISWKNVQLLNAKMVDAPGKFNVNVILMIVLDRFIEGMQV